MDPELAQAEEIYLQWLELPAAGHAEPFEVLAARWPALSERLHWLRDQHARLDEVRRSGHRSETSTVEAGVGDGGVHLTPSQARELEAHFPNLWHGLSTRRERFGRFDVSHRPEARLGEGHQGVVLRVRDSELERDVAIKFAKRNFARFLREARVMSQLDHPGVVPIYELGIDAADRPYYVMRMIEGLRLSEVLECHRDQPGGEWSRTRVLTILQRVCDTLAYAHERKVVHRDVKPDNIMVGRRGEVYVLDWGLAQVDGDDSALRMAVKDAQEDRSKLRLTRTGSMLGTLDYLSPEQVRGDAPASSPGCDIYAVGAVIYELLTGAPPYRDRIVRDASPDDQVEQVLHAIRAGPPTPVDTLAPQAGAELASICSRAMAWNARNRYGNMSDLADDLRAHLEVRVVKSLESGAWAEARKWARRNRLSAALLVSFLFLLPVLAALATRVIGTWPAVRERRLSALREQAEQQLEEGFFQLGEGSPQLALAAFSEASRLQPESQEALAGQSLALIKLGRREETLALLDSQPGQTSEAFASIRRQALAIDAPIEAEELQPTHTRESLTAVDHFLLGQVHMLRGHSGLARGFVEAAGHFDAANLLSKGVRYVFEQEYVHALAHIAEVGDVDPRLERLAASLLQSWPDSATAAFFSGLAFQKCHRGTEALAAYQAAIRLNPEHAKAHNNLGLVLFEAGRFMDARECYEAAIDLNGENREAFNNLGNALRELGQFEASISCLREALRMDPGYWEARYNLGVSLLKAGNFPEALAEFRHATELRPTAYGPWHDLGSRYLHDGDLDQARVAYERAIALNPGAWISLEALGMCLEMQGESDQGLYYYDRAVELAPAYPILPFRKGQLFLRQSRFVEAFDAFSQAACLAPELIEPQLGQASARVAAGKTDAAIAIFRSVLEQEPCNFNALVDLGVTLAQANDPEGASECFETAVRCNPQAPEPHLNLGTLLKSLGRYEEALQEFRTGHELALLTKEIDYDTASLVSECERLCALSERLKEVRMGSAPTDAVEAVALAEHAYTHSDHAQSAALYILAFGLDASLADQEANRYNAACSAALSACAAPESSSSAEAGTEHARQAVEWLRTDLARMKAEVQAGNRTAKDLLEELDHWLADSDLAGVRDGGGCPAISSTTRLAADELWAAVRLTIQTLAAPDTTR